MPSLLSHSKIALLLLVAALAAAPARAQSTEPAVEYRVKAAYLYNFTKFVDWPPAAFNDAAAPFVVAVVDRDGAAAAIITDALRDKTTPAGRRIEVRHLRELSTAAATACHQIFVTRSAGLEVAQIRAAIGTAPVLLVGETEAFAQEGGIVGFVRMGDAVRCDVNLAGAQRAGIKLSGRLASVARLVHENTHR
jgi:hypothetical protein